jgi:hypothetical protein
METNGSSQHTPDTAERNLARKLRRQVAEWKTTRAPYQLRTTAGVQVERRFRRRQTVSRIST